MKMALLMKVWKGLINFAYSSRMLSSIRYRTLHGFSERKKWGSMKNV